MEFQGARVYVFAALLFLQAAHQGAAVVESYECDYPTVMQTPSSQPHTCITTNCQRGVNQIFIPLRRGMAACSLQPEVLGVHCVRILAEGSARPRDVTWSMNEIILLWC